MASALSWLGWQNKLLASLYERGTADGMRSGPCAAPQTQLEFYPSQHEPNLPELFADHV
jgi:hypothetical protein